MTHSSGDGEALSQATRSVDIDGSADHAVITTGDRNTVNVTYIYRYDGQLTRVVGSEDEANPYVGIRAFRRQDAERYFGRDRQIDRLIEKFKGIFWRKDGHRLLPVLGPSGCGKSSLVMAGFIPALEKMPILGASEIQIITLVPGAYPVEALALVLEKAAEKRGIPAVVADKFEDEIRERHQKGTCDGLRHLVAKHLASTEQLVPIMIFVDQFEEIYSQCKDDLHPGGAAIERQIFIETLLNAARQPDRRVSVVLTLRSDFIGETQQHDVLNDLVASDDGVIVPSMNQQELREAIIKPGRQAGHEFEETFAQVVIDDVKGRDGALPLMQFALEQVWDGLETDKKTGGSRTAGDIYAEIGEVGGALASRVQLIYDGLKDEGERAIARRVFLNLGRFESEMKVTRRRVALETLVGKTETLSTVKSVVDQFASPEVRVITLLNKQQNETDDSVVAEVTHEALFEHWVALKDWVAESRDDIRFQRRLEEAAIYWKQQGRPAGLLWRSPDLDLLRNFRQKSQSEMSPLSADFYKASYTASWQGKQIRRLGVAILSVALIATTHLLHRSSYRQMELYTERARGAANIDSLDSLVNGLAAIGLGRSPFIKFPLVFSKPLVSTIELERANRTRQFSQVMGHASNLAAVSLSSDGETIVSGDVDGAVWLWELNGKQIQLPTDEKVSIKAVSLSEDGQVITGLYRNGVLQTWNRSGAVMDKRVVDSPANIWSASISQNKGAIVTSDATNRQAWLWSGSGALIRELTPSFSWPDTAPVAVSADGKTIVRGDSEGNVRVWVRDGDSLTDLSFVSHSGKPPARPEELSNDPSQGITMRETPAEQVYGVRGIAISSDGQTIVTGGWDGTVKLWTREGKAIGEPLEGHVGWVRAVDISADGQTIVSCGDDGALRLWTRAGEQIGEPLKGHSVQVESVDISSDGKRIVSAGQDGTVRVWQRDGSMLNKFSEEYLQSIYSQPSRTDEAPFIRLEDNQTVQLYANDGQPIGEPFAPDTSAYALSKDGEKVVTGSRYGVVQLWTREGTPIGEPIVAHSKFVRFVAFLEDDRFVLSRSVNETARVWPAADNDFGWLLHTCNRLKGYLVARSAEDDVVNKARQTCEHAWK
ncbi:MAG: hypothetical protein AAFY72_04220 [Cyanobacteria bacterium J06649_4]